MYTKDIRESTANLVDSAGDSAVSYEYTDYGETDVTGNEDFYNEVCYTGCLYDASTDIYYLNARYYDPENANFLSQDSYRGETEITGNESFYNEICYTGGIYDASTGIYYLNARYYDPETANFLSQDSYRGEIGAPESLNYYAYCYGNPITCTDPSGHVPILVVVAVKVGTRIVLKQVAKKAKKNNKEIC